MPDPKEGRREDPRGLSEQSPGRSKIQDEPPPLPTQRKAVEEKHPPVTAPSPSGSDLERRDARAHSAMPYGRKGSRRGKPLGGQEP